MADTENDARFAWTAFYKAVADKLRDYQNNRETLITKIHNNLSEMHGMASISHDRLSDGTIGPMKDICPFTTMATFNRGMTPANRRAIAEKLAEILDVKVETPSTESFNSIPYLMPHNPYFFAYENERGDGDIDQLWKMFIAALEFADSDSNKHRGEFSEAYDAAMNVTGVGPSNLPIGLYWIRPWSFPSLDNETRKHTARLLDRPVNSSNAAGYLQVIDDLREQFKKPDCPARNFPALRLQAFEAAGAVTEVNIDAADSPVEIYTADSIREEGCFLHLNEIQQLLERLKAKKNLILQGPPGTGKTWLAKRLAYALMGEKNPRNLRAVQFHPNLSYEDFVRGWRPSGDGKLTLTDGVFMQAVESALEEPEYESVVIIEEINRGNPAQIFGEMLTLLEAGKRNSADALELSYPGPGGENEPVYIPDNLYVIGTMNLADRSLALVDFALRRRFAFVTLEPKFTDEWKKWVISRRNVNDVLAEQIQVRIKNLNQNIADDKKLGPQFCIGHSYLTPAESIEDHGTESWFRQVVETEIFPLLEVYWFDDPDKPDKAGQERDKLLADWG